MALRRGVGRVRHLHTQYLWVQDKFTAKEVDLSKESSEDNVSDVCTKHVPAERMKKILKMLNVEIRTGESDIALKAA